MYKVSILINLNLPRWLLIELHFSREMYKRQYGVHQVNGTGKNTQHAHRDAYGTFGSHADVFVFVLVTDPIVQRYTADGDKHEHADEIHYDILVNKYKNKWYKTT